VNAAVGKLTSIAPAPHPLLEVAVARTLDELMQVMAVRTLIYLGDQDCPYAEEFDGNDFAGSTHLLARVGVEPAGTMRVRWFAGFAKIERAAVLPAYRGGGVSVVLMERALRLASDKGYRRVLAHGQVQLTSHWTRSSGFRVREARGRFVFSDHEYVELERDLPEAPGAINENTDPLVLNRPEGEWGRPGLLEASVARGAGAVA
jgi:predicted GNAT family N-acyltransferase